MAILMLDIPSIVVRIDPTLLIVESQKPMTVISSGVINGGLVKARAIIDLLVVNGYDAIDPVADILELSEVRGYPAPFVGMMTVAYLTESAFSQFSHINLTGSAIMAVGLSNSADVGLCAPVNLYPGTINLILLIDGSLSSDTMVNAVMTATEAKTAVLHDLGAKTSDGYSFTGTTTDSVVVAFLGRGASQSYAGSATPFENLVGRSVWESLKVQLS